MNFLPDALIFALFALALLCLGLGALAPSRPLGEVLVLPALATLGALGFSIWIFGSLGFYNGRFWALAFGALWLLWMIIRRPLVGQNARRLLPAWRALSRLEKALALYLATIFTLTFVLSLAPPNGLDYDGLTYHLAVPAQYARAGRVLELPYDHHSYFPFTLEMLMGAGLQIRGVVFAKLFHWLMLPLSAGVLVALGARGGSKLGGLWAACLFVSLPMTLTEASTAYIDLGFVAFAAAAVLCFAGAPTENRLHNLAWSGAFCGFCLGTKYFGWLLFGFLGIWLLVDTLRARKPGGVRQVLVFGLAGLALGGAWYGRNLVWVGNPVFPFAYGLFGGAGWTAPMARDYDASQAIYGFGRGLSDLIFLPWRLAMTPLNLGNFEALGLRGQPGWPLIPGPILPPTDPTLPNINGTFEAAGLVVQMFPGPAVFAFGIPALLARGKPRAIGLAAWAFGFLWVFLGGDQPTGALPVPGTGAFVRGGGLGHGAVWAAFAARQMGGRGVFGGVAGVCARADAVARARQLRGFERRARGSRISRAQRARLWRDGVDRGQYASRCARGGLRRAARFLFAARLFLGRRRAQQSH